MKRAALKRALKRRDHVTVEWFCRPTGPKFWVATRRLLVRDEGVHSGRGHE